VINVAFWYVILQADKSLFMLKLRPVILDLFESYFIFVMAGIKALMI
jgi:hypothetical protein